MRNQKKCLRAPARRASLSAHFARGGVSLGSGDGDWKGVDTHPDRPRALSRVARRQARCGKSTSRRSKTFFSVFFDLFGNFSIFLGVWGAPVPGNGKFRSKSFFCPQQSRKRTVKVLENRPGRFSKTPENLPGLSRVIFKVTEDFAFGKKALCLAGIMAKSLKFVLELYFCSLYSKKFLLKSSYRKKCLRAPARLPPIVQLKLERKTKPRPPIQSLF